MMNEIYDPKCPIFIERNGRKKRWVDENKVNDLEDFAKDNQVSLAQLADYFIGLGLSTLKHCPDQKIKFDIKELKF